MDTSLDLVRRRLDRLAAARLAFPLRERDQEEYRRLCQLEDELLARRSSRLR